ncbi:MAG: glucosyltransferase [Clostridia bacterium]|nr:glucosyltransferase [Clostridia bacterium]
MADIAFFCIPAHGHTNPTLPVVKALTDMGHRVTYYSYPPFREAIEAAGARFVDCAAGNTVAAASGNAVARDILVSTKLIVDTTLAMQDMALESLKALKPDVIVADSVAFWGKLFALRLGIPFISSTTTFAFNRHSSKVMKQGIGDLLQMLIKMPKAARLLKPLQDAGYPVKSVLDIVQNDENTPTVVYTSRAFQPCADTFSDKYRFVGPCLRPVTEPMQKLARALVYVSMGTVLDGEDDFYRNCVQALGDGRYEVILSVGESRPPVNLPENVHAHRRVDQLAVLQAADVFVTHCGMNSVSEALYFGVPLVTRPLTPEEGGVANRAEALGAGLRLRSADPDAIRAAVDAVMAEPRYREAAEKIGQGFRACGGPRAAAEAILEIATGA